MIASDLPDYAAQAIHDSPIADIHIFGRRGAAQAKWTNVELREMGELQNCVPLIDPAQIPDELPPGDKRSERDRRLAEKNLATLRGFAGVSPEGKTKRVHFEFCASPVEVLGGERVEGLRLERTRVEGGHAVGTGEYFEVACGLVIASIGYRGRQLPGVPFDEARGIVPNRDGRVAEGLYVVGWAKRGPSGVIGSNKPDAELVARHIQADLSESDCPGGARLAELLEARGVEWVSFDDWKAIEAAEIAAAAPGAPRQKLIRIKDMLAVLKQSARAKRAG
jgi:ferredoxin--NADP+ reductase